MNLKYRLIHNIGLPVSVLGKKNFFLLGTIVDRHTSTSQLKCTCACMCI